MFWGMTHSLNSTFVALIPKKPNAEIVSDFRPISLYNVLYKLVSKVMTNRLKPFMNDIIFNDQSAFISGRLIMDNIMAHELLYALKGKKMGKVGHIAVKLDMSKVYNRVE